MDNIEQLKEALRLSPGNAPLALLLGRALMDARRYDEAEQTYRDALKHDGENPGLKLGLAAAFLETGKLDAGLVVAEDLLNRNQDLAPARLLCARLLARRGDYAEAQEAYRQAVAKDAALADVNFELELRAKLKSDFQDFDGRVPVELPEEGGEVEIERPKIKFADVGGMDKVKKEIRVKIIEPLANPELYKAYGKKIGGGILLYGPPGCGKTHLARATAGEVQSGFIAVGLHDILDMWIGQSEKNLHAVFEQARRARPCVLFFDEVDALGASRADMRKAGGRHTINQFLSELDGVEASNEGVLILAATNTPWHLDPAFRRPGRFDRIVFIPPPDEAAREGILRILMQDKPAGTIDFRSLAQKTKEFSGADLKAVVDIAIESKLDESLAVGKALPIETRDLAAAASRHKPTTREWFSTARNYALYANDGGQYDEVLDYIKANKL